MASGRRRDIVITKRLLWESMTLTRDEVGHRETALHHYLMGRADLVEGVVAWLERRPPLWTLSVTNDWPDWPL